MPEARADEVPRSERGVAVVELFTSEGCSSCPPADLLLGDLARQNVAVYPLEFHVDYWNGLGWPDRFSSSDWTQRQRAYARSLGDRGLYTPQMIVGGTDPSMDPTACERRRPLYGRSQGRRPSTFP
jgi:hypothetical protein